MPTAAGPSEAPARAAILRARDESTMCQRRYPVTRNLRRVHRGMDGETRPVDYATINAVWISLAAALVAGTRGRASKDPITNAELIPLAAATFAVSKAVARERIGTWVREPF